MTMAPVAFGLGRRFALVRWTGTVSDLEVREVEEMAAWLFQDDNEHLVFFSCDLAELDLMQSELFDFEVELVTSSDMTRSDSANGVS